MYKSILCFCFSLLLTSCVIDTKYNIEYDKFKQDLSVCKMFGKEYESVSYTLCYINNKNENIEGYGIVGVYEMNSPVAVNFNEAILYNGQKLKISSKDDRRLGMTINTFKIKLDKQILDNVRDNLEIKIYGTNISYIIDLITKEDIKNFNQIVEREKQKHHLL